VFLFSEFQYVSVKNCAALQQFPADGRDLAVQCIYMGLTQVEVKVLWQDFVRVTRVKVQTVCYLLYLQ